MKIVFGGNEKGQYAPLAHAAAGSCATVLGDGIQVPVDTIKQRMQMQNSPYIGTIDCIKGTVRHQGFWALYRSYPTTLAMNVPFTAMHFTVYESAKIGLQRWGGPFTSKDENGLVDEETFFTQFTAGGLAGGLAAAATNPLDADADVLRALGVRNLKNGENGTAAWFQKRRVRRDWGHAVVQNHHAPHTFAA